MAYLITFRTTRFDAGAETPNPINPIAGQGVLNWLREELAKSRYTSTEPDTEDWGWYMNVEGEGGSYLIGASGDADASTSDVEWVVQVHKHRSLKEKILGRNPLTVDDPLVSVIERIVRGNNQISVVSVERDA
jgi:hypothetical protein